MPGCILYVIGEVFDSASALDTMSLQQYLVFRKTRRRMMGSEFRTCVSEITIPSLIGPL